jgi:glutamyl-tRNA reductase
VSELLALGVSHNTAPLELRERIALTEGRSVGVLSELTATDEIREAAASSTSSPPTRWRPNRRRSECSRGTPS